MLRVGCSALQCTSRVKIVCIPKELRLFVEKLLNAGVVFPKCIYPASDKTLGCSDKQIPSMKVKHITS